MKKKTSITLIAILCAFVFIVSSCSPKRGIVPCPSYGNLDYKTDNQNV